MFVRVADHTANAGQGCDFLWGALCIASRNNNFSQRILALHPADGGAGILVGGIRDGAGIQDY